MTRAPLHRCTALFVALLILSACTDRDPRSPGPDPATWPKLSLYHDGMYQETFRIDLAQTQDRRYGRFTIGIRFRDNPTDREYLVAIHDRESGNDRSLYTVYPLSQNPGGYLWTWGADTVLWEPQPSTR